MHKVSHKLQSCAEVTAAVFLIGIIFCVLVQVFCRYILKVTSTWTQEIAVYCFMWLTMVGAPLMVRRGEHFVIPLFIDKVKYKRVFLCMIDLMVLAVGAVFLLYGVRFVQSGLGKTSVAAHLPFIFVYIAYPIGGALTVFFAFEMLLEHLGVIPPAEVARDTEGGLD